MFSQAGRRCNFREKETIFWEISLPSCPLASVQTPHLVVILFACYLSIGGIWRKAGGWCPVSILVVISDDRKNTGDSTFTLKKVRYIFIYLDSFMCSISTKKNLQGYL